MYDINKLKKLATLGEKAPDAMDAFQGFNDAIFADGALSAKTKELIAVAVAVSKQCVYCMEVHQKNARQAGVSDQEIAEAIFVASAIGAGAAVTHGTHIID